MIESVKVSAKIIHTEVEGRKLKLTNLDKVIYPQLSVTKAEIIQYYMRIAPIMLRYIRNRPLTFIRFPDGINQKGFYSKDKPDWTPDWLASHIIQHDDKAIEYIMAQTTPSLVWMANLACLELHPTQFVADGNDYPDHFIFDLDPDDSISFDQIKECAFELKKILELKNYQPFIKTSGGKGLHIIVPVIASWTFDEIKECAKSISLELIRKFPNQYTLNVSKQKRKGKILIDIYRNHLSNTTVAPYSLRGRKGAPVSMPIAWEELNKLESPGQYNIRNVFNYLDQRRDPWQEWRNHEADLHTQKIQVFMDNNQIDERLDSYVSKRNLEASPEPLPRISYEYKNQFVVQQHNASNLHYDLRLEQNGVLLSWAIPKCLPYKVGQKRLAIRTEDHPIKYLKFEGLIPKGEYGAGQMYIFDTGQINWIKREEKKLHFHLKGHRINCEYKLYKLKAEDQWIIEVNHPVSKIDIDNQLKPMLANAAPSIPKGNDYKYEVKWDGIRALIYVEEDTVHIISRNGKGLTSQFPELLDPNFYNVEHGVFDVEIVVLDEEGRPIFSDVISRMHTGSPSAISKLQSTKPVVAYFFDMLSLDGTNILDAPLFRRRQWLSQVIKWNTTYRYSQSFDDGKMLYDAIDAKGMEGIMAKDQSAIYEPDTRSNAWLKVKCRKMDQCLIIGYTKGKGDRAEVFGALHLAKKEKGTYKYMGKVGTGFDMTKLKNIMTVIDDIEIMEKYIDEKIEEERNTIWIEPRLKCKLKYASLTNNGTYREPVFIDLIK